LFSVSSYKDYGKLSGRSLDDMIAGARVEVAPYKRDPMDFVLWKPSADDLPGWDSPWGRGRPGWHIECSAMSYELLGASFDIHGGGNDLMFPHHENEIAQSCCAYPDAGFANIWLHNEMLQVEGKKMSKSLGNFFTVRDLLDQGYAGEVIRFVFLSTHYGKPMDWTDAKAKEAEKTLRKWRGLVADHPTGALHQSILDTLGDDLNTAGVIAELHKLANAGDVAGLRAGAELLGLLTSDMGAWAKAVDLSTYEAHLFAARQAAMDTKDFSEVDRLKSAYQAAGLEVRMSKTGVELVPSAGFDIAALDGIM
jgi:cysteinyl-tRNA synthetase